MDSSEAIKNYASEKIAKLQKYLRSPLESDVTISLERHLHRVDVSVLADGKHYSGHEQSEDMYASIDKVMDKLDRQVRDAKAALVDRKRHDESVLEAKGKT